MKGNISQNSMFVISLYTYELSFFREVEGSTWELKSVLYHWLYILIMIGNTHVTLVCAHCTLYICYQAMYLDTSWMMKRRLFSFYSLTHVFEKPRQYYLPTKQDHAPTTYQLREVIDKKPKLVCHQRLVHTVGHCRHGVKNVCVVTTNMKGTAAIRIHSASSLLLLLETNKRKP